VTRPIRVASGRPAGRRPAGLGCDSSHGPLGPPRPLEALYIIAGLALVFRYRWILDDAFVYFRYADNFVFLRRGLVYNDGEFVEGFSSPLWMTLTILLRTSRLDWWTLTSGAAAAAFLVFALLLVRWNRALSPAGPVANAPLAYLAMCYGASCYFSSGLETPLVQIAAVVFAFFVRNPGSALLQAAVALMPLVRPELTLLLPIALAWAWRREACVPWMLLVSAALLDGTWLAFRIAYYADLFPNTFYLKDELAIGQGLTYVHQTARTYHLYGVLAAFALAAVWVARRTRDGFEPRWAERCLLAGAALLMTAYVVKIGGDFRHHRMLAFPFVLIVCALAGLAEETLQRSARARARWLAPWVGLAAAALAFSGVPPQLERHPVTLQEGHRIVRGIGDASWDRHHPALAFSERAPRLDRDLRDAYRGAAGRSHTGTLTTSMCVDAYLAFSYRVVNSLGLTDAFLARTDARTDWAGHKYSLHARAEELVALHRQGAIDRDSFGRLVEEGRAPGWISDNLASIEIVARKVYNRHDLLENLALAFQFPPRIRIPDWKDDPEA
jgi:hypothetical protein